MTVSQAERGRMRPLTDPSEAGLEGYGDGVAFSLALALCPLLSVASIGGRFAFQGSKFTPKGHTLIYFTETHIYIQHQPCVLTVETV